MLEFVTNPKTYDRRRLKPLPVDFVTYESNDFYNQREILARFCNNWIENNPEHPIPGGATYGKAIPGKLQHGWQWGTGVDDEGRDRIRHTNVEAWVWNKRNEQKANEVSVKSIAIGAPILYTDWTLEEEKSDPKGVLVIPSHSQSPFNIKHWEDNIRETSWFCSDFKRKTTLLYYQDYSYAKPLYEAYGFTVCCLGGPYAEGYLNRLKSLILAHEIVIGDKVSTSSFYANMWNRSFMIVGSALETEIPDPFSGPGGDKMFLKDTFPHFLKGEVNKDVALEELGISCKKSKNELKKLFNW